MEATPGEPDPEETTVPATLTETVPETTQEETASTQPETMLPEPTETIPEETVSEVPKEKDAGFGFAWLLAAGLLLLTAVLQRQLRLYLRRRWYHRGSVNRQALARWQEYERLCRILKADPDEELLTLAQRAKFSQHILCRQELEQMEWGISLCLEQLRKKPWYLRWIDQYIYAAY